MTATSNPNEIRLTRVYDAPVRVVWDAWTISEQVEKWWGPRGFTITSHRKELRVGGTWRYTMHGPDGVDYPNVITYCVVEACKKLEYDHSATDEALALFRVTVTFAEAEGRTTMALAFTLPSPEAAQGMTKLIRQMGGNATWDRLAEHLEQRATGKRCFVINRVFDAPIARVFEMWTRPEHLVRWLPPAGAQAHFLRSEIGCGKSTLCVITSELGAMQVRTEYLAIESPRRIVYTQQFVDQSEQVVSPPGVAIWPPTLRTIVLLAEEAPDRTRVTVTSEPIGTLTADAVDAFARERPGMTLGWTGSFDTLERLLGAGGIA